MMQLTEPRPRARRAAPAPATRQARIQLASDGVVAAYLHDIARGTSPALSRSRSPSRRRPATRR
jgi:hypothetical protein